MVFPHRREQAQVLLAPEQPGASFRAADFEGTGGCVCILLKKSICKSIVLSWLTS